MTIQTRNTALAILKRKDGKILIGFSERINSGDSKVVDSHSWKFPQGGIDEGEDSKQAIIRELKEELDIDLILDDYEYETIDSYVPYYFRDEFDLPKFEVKLHPFLINYNQEDEFNFDKEEFSGLKWLKPEEILKLKLGIRKDAYIVILKKFDLL